MRLGWSILVMKELVREKGDTIYVHIVQHGSWKKTTIALVYGWLLNET